MFHLQDTEQALKQNKCFYENQKQYCIDNDIKLRKKDYLSYDYFQFLTEQIQDKTQDKEIQKLFAYGCDILIRHCITSKQFIQYNNEDKTEFYSYAQFRIFNFALKTYNREKAKAFVYLSSAINNAFKQVIKDNIRQKSSAYRYMKSEGLQSQIGNIDTQNISDFEEQYFNFTEDKINLDIPPFIQELSVKYSQYKLKPLRILNEENVPRFKRSYTEFDYYLEIEKDKGIVIEYIDLFEFNENNGISKNHFKNRLIKARENGYQTFFLFSDVYNDENINDGLLWSRLDRMIEGIKFNYDFIQDSYLDYSGKTITDPMLSYIPTSIFLDKQEELLNDEPNWYWLDKHFLKRHISNQDIEEYLRLKKEDSSSTRIYDCGKLYL